ncbi:MAG: energy-coupling factor transporter transmembrane protein EcfT [Chloroflexi bacterium]|nr:energy-coupling factor transporter transmembrane protein EcfT [Chloroflexota bacterium]
MIADFHPYTWLLWLAAAAGAALLVRNPLYLLITLLAVVFVYSTLIQRQRHEQTRAHQPYVLAWRTVFRLVLFIWGLTILFNALSVHLGDVVLFRLPRSWPLIGGPITLEAALYGFVTGLSFTTLILAFMTMNIAVSPHTLLRLTPAFAHHAGVAVTIAISFIPQTFVAWQEIREAQRLRGYHVRGLRDMQPLFVSLLANGLERAIQLAESMDARGFGGHMAAISGRERWLLGLSSMGGLVLLLIGLILRSFRLVDAWISLGSMTAGAVALLWVLHRQGRRLRRSQYRRWLWRRRDTFVSSLALFILLTTIILSLVAAEQLFYYPYPPYSLIPTFNPLLSGLYALLLCPALLLPAHRPHAQWATPEV